MNPAQGVLQTGDDDKFVLTRPHQSRRFEKSETPIIRIPEPTGKTADSLGDGEGEPEDIENYL